MPSYRSRSRSRSPRSGERLHRSRHGRHDGDGEYERRKSRRDDHDRDRGRDDRRHRDSSRDRPRSSRHPRDDDRDRHDSRDDRHKSSRSTRDRRRENDSESEDDFLDLRDLGVDEISPEDYFLKSAEFKHWLKADRGKYIDEVSSEEAHRYFRKFVRRWNDGALDRAYYHKPKTSSSNTAYKWNFKGDYRRPPTPTPSPSPGPPAPRDSEPRREQDDEGSSDEGIGPSLPRTTVVAGPSRPTASDRQMALEDERDARRQQKKAERKSAYEKADEAAPRGVGKEGKLAEKKASNAVNKEMRDKEVGGLEVDEGTLMGEGSSFQAALKARDAAEGRRSGRRQDEMEMRRAMMDERMAERKQKEDATMSMLRAMAKERFG